MRSLVIGGVLFGVLLVITAKPILFGPYCAGAAPQSMAVTYLRSINTAEMILMSSEQRYGTLEELTADNLLDSPERLKISDYAFSVVLADAGYRATAVPRGKEGRTDYYTGPDNVVRYGPLAPSNLVDNETF
ncbi:MAG TPA: hypothetical protein VKY31_06670 [Terriglobia bacterium]|nr:hypothetical protein [Terriglobia bacterium]